MQKPPYNVASTTVTINDVVNHLSFPVLIHYPTMDVSTPTNFGPFTIDVAVDGTIPDGQFPLVIISHGNSGSQYLYRTISTHLATRGYIVAMPEHYGNNRRDNVLSKSVKNLEYRPQHLSLVIDFLLNDSDFHSQIDATRIAVIGHSFGGYTALAVAGGKAYSMQAEEIATKRDHRVKAIVLMAPAAGYFSPDAALSAITVPILLYIGSQDHHTPKQWTADVILKGVPNQELVRLREIQNAGHFSFISPFPEAMTSPDFLPSTDPEGFDRSAFHGELPKEILAFLNDSLSTI